MSRAWSESEVATFVELWNNDVLAEDIAFTLKRTSSAVHMYATNHRERLGLKVRNRHHRKQGQLRVDDAFNKAWYGSVPFKHWAMVGKWSKENI